VRCFRTVSPTLTLGLPGLPSLFSSVTPQKLPIKSFEDYISLFGDDESGPIASSKLTKRWRVGVMPSPNGSFNQVSFVNGISTYKGGKHVDAAAEQVVRHLVDHVNKRHAKLLNGTVLTSALVKPHLSIFVAATIESPAFDSQMKEMLTTHPMNFGSTLR